MAVKKTHEQFVAEMVSKNPETEVLGEYIGRYALVKVQHKTCGYSWYSVPGSLLKGHGCPKCAGCLKKTNEQFVAELANINRNITSLEKYTNAKTRMLFECKLDGYKWCSTANGVLTGAGCPECALRKRRKTHSEFVTELSTVNPNVELLCEYKTGSNKVKVRCKIDEHEWYARPTTLLDGYGCPVCNPKRLKTQEEFVSKLQGINSSVLVIGRYQGNAKKVDVRCLVCGREWSTVASNLLAGHGCAVCKNAQYNPSKQSHFYVYQIDNSALGFGITNVPKRRHMEHNTTFKKSGIKAKRIITFSGDGQAIQNFESHLKRTLPIVNTGVDGFKTEAILYEDRELLFKAIEEFHYRHNSPLQDSEQLT